MGNYFGGMVVVFRLVSHPNPPIAVAAIALFLSVVSPAISLSTLMLFAMAKPAASPNTVVAPSADLESKAEVLAHQFPIAFSPLQNLLHHHHSRNRQGDT
jgi:hypothetical protein